MPKHATLGVDGKVPAAQLPEGGPGGGVTSVYGRAGAVVAAQDDYTFAQLASKPTTLSGYGITDSQPLAAVLTATTASYTTTLDTKLGGIASGAEVNVNADWNSGSGDSQILNKPSLGGAAALNVGTITGTVAAGDHTHTGVYQPLASVLTNTTASFTTAFETLLGNTSGTNSGDNATNTQYSGLAASKQDTLVSATNIKTINGASVLGSGDLTVSGQAGDFDSVLTGSSTISANKVRTIGGRLQIADGGGILIVEDTGALALI